MKNVKWIKLDVDMYKNQKICRVREALGNEGCYFWAVLLMIAGAANFSGALMLSAKVPFTAATLAKEAGVEANLARKALRLFMKFDMLRRENGCYVIRDWENHQNAAELERLRAQARVRQARRRQKLKEEASEQFQREAHTTIE